jgi:hypothetical protein
VTIDRARIAVTSPRERSLTLRLIADILEDQPMLRIMEVNIADMPRTARPKAV